jgi:hypothetical protein
VTGGVPSDIRRYPEEIVMRSSLLETAFAHYVWATSRLIGAAPVGFRLAGGRIVEKMPDA